MATVYHNYTPSKGPRPNRMARSMRDREAESRDWEAVHNVKGMNLLDFDPDSHDEHGLTRREYVDAYYRAFVAGKDTYNQTRGSSDAVWYWFVEITGEMTPEEYDGKYGASDG